MATKAHPKVYIVTPIHNGLKHTLAYLKSLSALTYTNCHVIIIDDGSTDGSKEAIRSQYPNTILLEGDGNLWWTGATNLGVQYAIDNGADYVYTINNDVEIDQDAISELVNYAESHPDTLLGCKIYYIDHPEDVWYFGADLDNKIADITIYNGKDTDFAAPRTVGVLTGMGVLIPIAVFAKIGMYDLKHLPQYFADSDFSLRAGEAGYTCTVIPGAKVYSDVDSSWVNNQLANPRLGFLWQAFTADRSPYSLKVRFYFYRRHWGAIWPWILAKFYVRFVYHFVIKGFGPAYARKHLRFLRPVYRQLKKLRRSPN